MPMSVLLFTIIVVAALYHSYVDLPVAAVIASQTESWGVPGSAVKSTKPKSHDDADTLTAK